MAKQGKKKKFNLGAAALGALKKKQERRAEKLVRKRNNNVIMAAREHILGAFSKRWMSLCQSDSVRIIEGIEGDIRSITFNGEIQLPDSEDKVRVGVQLILSLNDVGDPDTAPTNIVLEAKGDDPDTDTSEPDNVTPIGDGVSDPDQPTTP
jgi:hypothetical protein